MFRVQVQTIKENILTKLRLTKQICAVSQGAENTMNKQQTFIFKTASSTIVFLSLRLAVDLSSSSTATEPKKRSRKSEPGPNLELARLGPASDSRSESSVESESEGLSAASSQPAWCVPTCTGTVFQPPTIPPPT